MKGRTMKSEGLDGGYGWVVVAFAFLSQAITTGVTWSTGVFYVLFSDNLRSNPTSLALISALVTSIFCLTGPLSAFFTNRYGCRPVHMVGGVVMCGGLVLTGFAHDPYILGFSFGVVTGLGAGLCFLPSLNIVSLYFTKRRTLAMGLSICGAGMGTLVFPPFIRMLYDIYGYQGANIITGGVCLHLVVCGAIFKPIKNHRKNLDPLKPKEDSTKTKWSFNLHIFKDLSFDLLCLNNFFTMMSFSVMGVHFAAYASTLGFSETSCATLYSGLGISNFIGRVIYSVMGLSPKVKPVHFYTGVYFFAGVITLFVPLFKVYWLLMGYMVCFGFYAAVYCIALPLFIVECLSPDLMPSGYGYILVFDAVGQGIGGPLAGLLYKHTDYYGSSLLFCGAVILLAGFLMIYPCYQLTRKSKQRDVKINVQRVQV